MSRRWLAGAVLFALGFGCAKLVTLPAAGAAPAEGVVDGTLEFVDGVDDFKLIYPPGGEAEYLVVVERKAELGSTADPQISYDTGSAVISKQDLVNLTVFRVESLLKWEGNVEFCDPGGPVQCTLPPPPRPPIWHHFRTLNSKPL